MLDPGLVGMLALPSASGEELWQPVPSLWRMVAEQVEPSERLEVKTIIGDDLVERSLELHAEVQTLMELCKEMQLGYPRMEQSPVKTADSWALLAAPPHLKELVREEIRLLLIGLQQKALQDGRDQDCVIAKYSPHVVTFALKANASSGNSVPIKPLTFRAMNDLGSLCNKLSITHVGKVASRLRALLEDECCSLEQYILHLQYQLEEAHHHSTQLLEPTNEPTMAELQEEKHAMERDLQLSQHGPCLSPSLRPKVLEGSICQPQPSHPGGSAKEQNLIETSPALSAAALSPLRSPTSPLCHQAGPWWSQSAQDPLEGLQRDGEEPHQAQKDSDPCPSSPVLPALPKGRRVVSACRTAMPGLLPAFHPKPPPEPCPVPRFCPRSRLLRCKGPS